MQADVYYNCLLKPVKQCIEGLVPAIPPDDFLKHKKPKRQIKPKKYTDYISKNLVDRHSLNNNRCFFFFVIMALPHLLRIICHVIENCKTEQLKHPFFVRTVVEWNHLDTELVHAETAESFKDQGRRRVLKSGTAIERHRRSARAEATSRGSFPPLVRGVRGSSPEKIFKIIL